MKIYFPIYWIDDNTNFCDSIRDEIEEHVRDTHGLKLQIDFNSRVDGALEKIRTHNPYLVIVDFRLGGGTTGDVFINDLRRNHLYHDVLFYTQDGFDNTTLQSFFRDPTTGLSMGVHFAAKGSNTKTRLCSIIDLKLSQVSDLPTQRGWIVADAIELESEINDLISCLSSSIHTTFGKTIDRLLEDHRVDFGCKLGLINGVLKDLIKYINSQSPGHAIVQRLNSIKHVMSSFSPEIIEIRNSIAHQKHTSNDNGQITIITRQGTHSAIEFNPTFLQKVRLDIIKHHQNIEVLKGLLQTEIPQCLRDLCSITHPHNKKTLVAARQ
jgi:hypothetical protein